MYRKNAMEKNLFSRLFPKNIRFWAKSQSIVGIDIGASSVKIVQLRKEKEQAILETYGELASGPYSNPKGFIGNIAQLPDDAVIAMLKDIFKESGMNAKEAAVAIPIKSSFVTTIKIPLVSGKSMGEVVKFEARKYIPVPLSEVEMDWWILENNKKDQTEADSQKSKARLVEVLLVVIHKEVIQKYRKILNAAGLKIKLFEIEIFSAWRSSVFRPTAPVMIIDLGASTTKMSVVDAGVLKTSHIIDKGSQAITTAISKSLGIGFERAEEIKRQTGLSPKPEYKELVNVIESVLNFIFAESKQFMFAYRRKYNDSVSRVILAGGGALMNNIVDTAVKNLGVEIVIADPFSKVEYPPFLQETLKEIGPTFSTAVGLALRGI